MSHEINTAGRVTIAGGNTIHSEVLRAVAGESRQTIYASNIPIYLAVACHQRALWHAAGKTIDPVSLGESYLKQMMSSTQSSMRENMRNKLEATPLDFIDKETKLTVSVDMFVEDTDQGGLRPTFFRFVDYSVYKKLDLREVLAPAKTQACVSLNLLEKNFEQLQGNLIGADILYWCIGGNQYTMHDLKVISIPWNLQRRRESDTFLRQWKVSLNEYGEDMDVSYKANSQEICKRCPFLQQCDHGKSVVQGISTMTQLSLGLG